MLGEDWKGDTLIADTEELKEMDASELHARRLNAKEVLTPMRSDYFCIPSRRWNSQNPWRRSTSETMHHNQGSSGTRRRTRNSLKRIRRTFLQTLFKITHHGMMRKLKMTSGLFSGDFFSRHHVEPRVKLYVPREGSFPIQLKFIDVTRNTHTSQDILLEKNIDDYWNVDGERVSSDAWTSFTRFILLNDGYTWSGVRLTRKMSAAAISKAKQKWAIEKPKLDNVRQLRGIFFIEPDGEDFKVP